MPDRPLRSRLASLSVIVGLALSTHAVIIGPYTPDASTLHLWHLNENSIPAVDAAPGGTNLTVLAGGATMGNASYAGFGTALSTASSTGAYLAGKTLINGGGDETLITYADPVSGAFTYEALVRIDFNPATYTSANPIYIVCAENDASPAGAQRPWQFAILPPGSASGSTFRIRFYNSNGNLSSIFSLPTTGPDALAQGSWYHVAATYNGGIAGGNLRVYWTLMDSNRVQATEIGSALMNDLTPLATGSVDFSIGNVGRTTPNGGFPGLIDEVRLSKIARAPGDMMFTSTNVVIVTAPASRTVPVGQALALSVAAAGMGPLKYQWRFNSAPIAGATLSTYGIAAVQLADWGKYDVIVTNNFSAATSAVALVNIAATNNPLALRIMEAGTNFILTWPIATLDWGLQVASNITAATFWQFVTNPVVAFNNENNVTVPDDGGQKHFRLHAVIPPPPTNGVFPIDWTLFQAGLPTDTNAQLIVSIIRNACKYAMTTWWTNVYASQDAATYLNLGGIGEAQIRRPAMEAYNLAVALQTGVYDAASTGISATNARARTLKLIRSVGFHHLINEPGGWGNDWQTAHWAALTGTAGWLLWTNLPPVDQEYVRRMVEYEANRFTNYAVPYYQNRAGTIMYPGDTKTEENAWNASVLHLALNMMPGHSNVLMWHNKALELTISTHARPSDINRTNIYHGRTLAAWLNGSNANEDSTVINHSIVHSDYMVAGLGEFQPALVYLLAGKPVPASSFFNVDLMYDAMVDLNFVAGSTPYPVGGALVPPGGNFYVRTNGNQPTGGMYFPQGNDWGTSRRMHVATLDCTVHAFGLDGLASIPGDQWEIQHNLTVFGMQNRFTDGRTYGASSEDTYSLREEWVANYAGKSFLTKWLVHQSPVQVSNAP